jgi:hypothetical protein
LAPVGKIIEENRIEEKKGVFKGSEDLISFTAKKKAEPGPEERK